MSRKTDSTPTPTPRAEALRLKRKTQQTPTRYNPRKITQASQRSQVVAARPITTRRSIPGVVTKKKVQTNQKKAYYVSLPAGAEIRLPAMPTIQIGWRLVSVVIVLAMLAALWMMWNSPTFQISQVKLTGAKRLTADNIDTTLNIQGMRAVEVKPQELTASLLKAYPDLSKASVQLSFPAKLTVNISERQPVLAWQQDGKTQWIDKQGFAFPVRGDGGSLVQVSAQGNPPSPVVTPPADPSVTPTPVKAPVDTPPAPFLKADLLDAILTLSPQVPKDTPIVYDPQYGLGWVDPGGWQVFFGSDTTHMDSKLAQYRAIVAQLKQQGVTPKLISVEFPYAPFYRLEK